MWNLPPPPGFQGLRDDKPLDVYIRHLPHWRQDGVTYFVTFRLHDSLPRSKLKELEQIRDDWFQRNPPPHSRDQLEELAHETMVRVERWLDGGAGDCWLKEQAFARLVADAMHFFDNERYELGSYVIMPNHVHAVVRPLLCDTIPLERICQSWKRHAAVQINERIGRHGALWQAESYDRIIRDAEHLYRVIQYIGANPSKAELAPSRCLMWIRPEWEVLGWRFERAC